MKDSKSLFFEKLTPTDDCDISIYESAIDFAFKEDDIRNVAISGAYGAGKSSVLAAYKAKHREKKFLHISLAHFKDNVKEVSSNNNNEYSKEAILEGKILNQLIRQIPLKKIPQTVFRVKESKSNKVIILYVVLTLLFLLSLFPVFFFGEWTCFFGEPSKGLLSLFTKQGFRIFSGVVCLCVFGFYLYKLFTVQKNKNLLKKLNIYGNEIEIFDESRDSIFDKYLNELLYLLDKSETDVIVFEDIDRYDTQKLFEKLREINTLANINRNNRGSKKIIRFFYLIRDDIFTSKDRTKFFDYIIPIIPVIDSSNSYDQIIFHLKKNGLESEFDERFLQGISLYIDDMRVLKNICNEFLIYYNRLNTIELDYNKMFALITYKNLFPHDYKALQLNKGFVYNLFNHKKELIEKKIEMLQAEVDAMEHETPEDVASQSIIEINNEIQRTKNSKLASLLERENIDSFFREDFYNENEKKEDFSGIRTNEYFSLLKYLVRNGYIDESYPDYMTYFYPNSLSHDDKIFLRSVTDKKAKPYEYELKSPEKVFERLNINDFDQEEILNYSLCEYLLSIHRESQHLERMIAQLRNTNNIAFIEGFFECTEHIPEFIKSFNKYWPNLFELIQEGNSFSQEEIKRFSVETLYNIDEEMLDIINENGALTNYISSTGDYLSIYNPNIEILIKAFKYLDVEITKIDYESANKDLLKEVYENDLYALNFNNIALILEKIWGIGSIEDIRHKNYSVICTAKDSPLYQRVENNMPDYINIILEECEGKIYDEEEAVINILNREDIDSTYKKKYIDYLETLLNDLTKFEDYSIWNQLLDSGLLVCSEKNIWYYLEEKQEIDSSLTNYINNADRSLDFSQNSIGLSEEEQNWLLDNIVGCNEINDQQYREIIASLGKSCDDFNIPDIHYAKMRILVDNDIIEMNRDTLKYIREEYQSVLFEFIRKNIQTYLDIMDGTIFSQDELEEILKWDIDDSYKIDLLSYSSSEMTIIDKHYSSAVSVHILENNLNQSDMEVLYQKYSEQCEEVKEFILDYATENIDDLAIQSENVDETLVKGLLSFNEITLDMKKHLLSAMLQYISKDKAYEYLTDCSLDNFRNIFHTRTKPKFEMTDNNRELLEAFKKKGWIYEYLEDENKPGYYKIRRRKRRG